MESEASRQRTGSGAGRPAPFRSVACLLVAALGALLAASVATVAAADELARGAFAAPDVVLAVHLVVIGFLPLAVAGAVFHVLPLFLRGVPSTSATRLTLGGLLAGPVLAVAVARHHVLLERISLVAVAVGLGTLVVDVLRLVVTAPRGRIVVVSRVALVAVGVHTTVAFAVGPLLFERRWLPWAGIPHDRLIAMHLHLALVGGVALLVVAVGRTLLPMLTVAPTAPRRRFPVGEIVLVGATWLGCLGLALGSRPVVALGGIAAVGVLAGFARFALLTLRGRRVPAVEGPVVHAIAGGAFVAQSAVLGVLLAGDPQDGRVLVAYAASLLLGFGAGVTLGHVGKVLAVSAWTWWPPGPRPPQAAFYRRGGWLGSAAAWTIGVELVVAGTLAGSEAGVVTGALSLVLGSVLAIVAAAGGWAPAERSSRAAGGS